MARQKDCQSCPVKDSCLPAKQKRRYFTLTMYYPEYLKASTIRNVAGVRPSRKEPSLPSIA